MFTDNIVDLFKKNVKEFHFFAGVRHLNVAFFVCENKVIFLLLITEFNKKNLCQKICIIVNIFVKKICLPNKWF